MRTQAPYHVLFREVQQFRQGWVSTALVVPLVICLAFALCSLALSLGLMRGPSLPTGDWKTTGILLLTTAGMGLVGLLLLRVAALTAEVRADGLFVQFYPFQLSFNRIPLNEVVEVRAVTYRPILDYGGYGIRLVWKGKAYTISGNVGVRLDFASGKHLLIGSQRPEELLEALRTLVPAVVR